MSQTEIVLQGTLSADGTLHLDEKPPLPAGRVQVIVQPLPVLPQGDPFWDLLQSIWAGQRARGHVPRSVAQVEADRREQREGWARRQEVIDQLQEEARRLRGQP